MERTILVTGGAGFIGSNFLMQWISREVTPVINLDKLTYAGNQRNLERISSDARYHFLHGDIADRDLVRRLLQEHRPDAVVHFAAESHVDRSICGPDDFIRTNIVGTFCLLEEARAYWSNLDPGERAAFRFLHISTDEVYGSLGPTDAAFSEATAYAPNSPYSASKAASDHFVRAYHSTYGLPTVTTNCSNNYGPFQFPEKLIPLVIVNALAGKPLPVYGDGRNVRDWLYVGDHCEAIWNVLVNGRPGETYNIGGHSEKSNIDIVEMICDLWTNCAPPRGGSPASADHVRERPPGHDRRYAIDSRKIGGELGWAPRETFETGIRKTILWYLKNEQWRKEVTSGAYREWTEAHYSNQVSAATSVRKSLRLAERTGEAR